MKRSLMPPINRPIPRASVFRFPPTGQFLIFNKLQPIRDLLNIRLNARCVGWEHWDGDYERTRNGDHPCRPQSRLYQNPHNINPITEQVQGIYMVVSTQGPIFYIGSSKNNLVQRLETHITKIWALRSHSCQNHTGSILESRKGWKAYAKRRHRFYTQNLNLIDQANDIFISWAEVTEPNKPEMFEKNCHEQLKLKMNEQYGNNIFDAVSKLPRQNNPIFIQWPDNWDDVMLSH